MMDNRDRVLIMELSSQRSHQTLVNFDGDNPASGIDEPCGKRSKSRPDLDNVISWLDLGESNNTVYLVRINQEVLTERLVRVQPKARQEFSGTFRSVTNRAGSDRAGSGQSR